MNQPDINLARLEHPNVSLRQGVQNYTLGVEEKHPVHTMQRLRKEEEFQLKLDAATHGFHLPVSKKIERTILGKTGRLPGLPSRLTGLETMMNLDDNICFEDYLGVIRPDDGLHGKTHQEWLEQKLNL